MAQNIRHNGKGKKTGGANAPLDRTYGGTMFQLVPDQFVALKGSNEKTQEKLDKLCDLMENVLKFLPKSIEIANGEMVKAINRLAEAQENTDTLLRGIAVKVERLEEQLLSKKTPPVIVELTPTKVKPPVKFGDKTITTSTVNGRKKKYIRPATEHNQSVNQKSVEKLVKLVSDGKYSMWGKDRSFSDAEKMEAIDKVKELAKDDEKSVAAFFRETNSEKDLKSFAQLQFNLKKRLNKTA